MNNPLMRMLTLKTARELTMKKIMIMKVIATKKDKKRVGRLIETIKDHHENYKIWRPKGKSRNLC